VLIKFYLSIIYSEGNTGSIQNKIKYYVYPAVLTFTPIPNLIKFSELKHVDESDVTLLLFHSVLHVVKNV
jgi:hypothetical protein